MLVNRTPWMRHAHYGFAFTRRKDYTPSLYVCSDGLKKLFNIPPDVTKVRFYTYDKPTKNSLEFELVYIEGLTPCIRFSRRFSRSFSRMIEVIISPYITYEKIKQLLSKQKYYYVECEYI